MRFFALAEVSATPAFGAEEEADAEEADTEADTEEAEEADAEEADAEEAEEADAEEAEEAEEASGCWTALNFRLWDDILVGRKLVGRKLVGQKLVDVGCSRVGGSCRSAQRCFDAKGQANQSGCI